MHLNDHIHYDIKIIPKEIVDSSHIDHKCDALTHLLSVSRLLLKIQPFAGLLWIIGKVCWTASRFPKKKYVLGVLYPVRRASATVEGDGAIARLFTLSEGQTHRYDPGYIDRILGDYKNPMKGVLRM